MDNGQWFCAATSTTHSSFRMRYCCPISVRGDCKSINVTVFENVGKQLFGCDGQTMSMKSLNDQQKIGDDIIEHMYEFKIKATINKFKQLSYSLMQAIPLSNIICSESPRKKPRLTL